MSNHMLLNMTRYLMDAMFLREAMNQSVDSLTFEVLNYLGGLDDDEGNLTNTGEIMSEQLKFTVTNLVNAKFHNDEDANWCYENREMKSADNDKRAASKAMLVGYFMLVAYIERTSHYLTTKYNNHQVASRFSRHHILAVNCLGFRLSNLT
ncbi:hypothetical protein CARUB_v10006509mg [Capsella rubella]|uniref:Uncharacterized protein n=1 Tax=Capsella rubella TaxID=81985 RepID=R0H3H6_9BRAS|nr:hypothetical protein CARUB_v10006509mg [Capsella rubella]